MISVVMATRDGEQTLPLTLEAFAELAIPEGGAEFIVVDNGSADRTWAILEAHAERLPLKLLREPTAGRTRALNAGIRAAAGALIVITDDDVLPDPGWLEAFERAAKAHPDSDLFAGQVRHFWQKKPPAWLERLAAEGLSYGGTPLELREGPINPNLVKGANFAARKPIFERFEMSESLGYGAGGTMVAGDETDFARRAVLAGHKARFLPAARLRHIVRPHEVAVWPVLRRYFRIGRGMAAIDPDIFEHHLPTLLGVPRYLLKTLPRDIGVALGRGLRGDTYACMKDLIAVAMTMGQAYQWRLARREAAAGAQSRETP